MRLREKILAGELAGGERIIELTIVQRLGVSRTPIRAALMKLEQEGLLELVPTGEYSVRVFSEKDTSETIELAGQLEGLLATLTAERGATAVLMNEPKACLQSIDLLLTQTF